MKTTSTTAIEIGDELQPLAFPPISRTTLALFAGASGDHNPMHIDIDFAKKAGADDVFAHGMLVMAYLGQLLTNWLPQERIRELGVRFTSVTQIHAQLTCTGKVVEKYEEDGEERAKLSLQVTDENGDVKIVGDAVVLL